MAMPMQPLRRPITADSALMNPNTRILALKGRHLPPSTYLPTYRPPPPLDLPIAFAPPRRAGSHLVIDALASCRIWAPISASTVSFSTPSEFALVPFAWDLAILPCDPHHRYLHRHFARSCTSE
jgi:hypothetical protein